MLHDALPEVDTLLKIDGIRDGKDCESHYVDHMAITPEELASNVSVLSASQNLPHLTKLLRS